MEWVDDGLVIGVRQHGETAVVVDLLTRSHGRHSGFVHGGRSRRLRPMLQPGNDVRATWKARSEEQLGTLVLEPLVLRVGRLMESVLALQGANLICALARLLPERDPQPDLYEAATVLLDRVDDHHQTPIDMVRFEMMVLTELGFGLDLARCAVTGERENLGYVSPRSGRAVTRAAGAAYSDRLLTLPPFLGTYDAESLVTSLGDLLDGFRLTAHFLSRDIFAPRGIAIPECRAAYIRSVQALVG